MKNILVVGKGKWGRTVIKSLDKISNIKQIINSKVNYKKISTENIDWVFVLTPDQTHYKIVEFFLKKKINVFCEKPLTNSYAKALKLIKISKKKRVKLYIDDIEYYKRKKIDIRKNNFIIRVKKDSGTIESILNRLTYHDMYLLYPLIGKLKKLKTIIIDSKNVLNFKLYNTKYNFVFFYNLNSDTREHFINDVDLTEFHFDALTIMLKKVLNNKCNFNRNHNVSLFATKLLENVRKKLK
ncbi:MAG: hypothetical protein CMF94_05310 [Candidatus Marinimicrobia bacterium]|nr:hypothetical protein [Candidatus Neomarinimicrobiota bacterium]|tara:strand:- start:86 stop:805 length:720 start_codon:yes stop_codon:yes gene_type:complete